MSQNFGGCREEDVANSPGERLREEWMVRTQKISRCMYSTCRRLGAEKHGEIYSELSNKNDVQVRGPEGRIYIHTTTKTDLTIKTQTTTTSVYQPPPPPLIDTPS